MMIRLLPRLVLAAIIIAGFSGCQTTPTPIKQAALRVARTAASAFGDEPAPEGADASVDPNLISLAFPIAHDDRWDLATADGSIEVAWVADVEVGPQQYRIGYRLARPAGTPAEHLTTVQLLARGHVAVWVPKDSDWVEYPQIGNLTASVVLTDVNITVGDANFIRMVRAGKPPFAVFHWMGKQYFSADDSVTIRYDKKRK